MTSKQPGFQDTTHNRNRRVPRRPTNMLTWSEMMSFAIWLKSDATVDADVAVAPNGTTTMDRLNVNASTAEHRAANGPITTVSGLIYTLSAYLKDDGAGFATISNGGRFFSG